MAGRETEVITSPGNAIVKRARSLLRRKGRYEERAFLVEGVRAVTDVLAKRGKVEAVLVRADATSTVDRALIPSDVPVRVIEAALFDAISEVSHAQGIVAIVGMDSLPQLRHDLPTANRFVLVVDGVRDPGNLGTLVRSAAGGGVSEVLLTPETVDPFNARSVRAAMGAYLRIPFATCRGEELHERLVHLPTVAVAEAEGIDVYTETDWTGECAVIVGGEAEGVSAAARALATTTVRIPLSNCVESLNAGVAGSLLIFEAARQRRLARSHHNVGP